MDDIVARLAGGAASSTEPVLELPADSTRPNAKQRPAAVLVPIMNRPAGPTLLFTLRSSRLNSHAGQISFPGGRIDDTDAGLREAALREAWEEIGLPPERVKVLCRLPPHRAPAAEYMVTAFVGLIDPSFVLTRNANEVEEIFEVPLSFFLNPRNRRIEDRVFDGNSYKLHVFYYGGHRIWGLTARLTATFLDLLVPGGAEADNPYAPGNTG